MKMIIYFILIIAFLMFYQNNPVFAVILIVLTVGIYLFFKARKSRGLASSGSFLTGSQGAHVKSSDDLLKLMLLQQMITPGTASLDQHTPYSPAVNKRHEKIEKTKQEVLELLED